MKILTKLLFTLALTVVGLEGAKAANPGVLIKEVDFSTMAEYTMWKSSLVNLSINEGTIQIVNETAVSNWEIQYEGASGFFLKEHGNYIVRLTLKGSVAGSLTCAMGSWGTTKNGTVSFTTEMKTVDVLISDFTETVDNAHVLLQSGAYVGTINISKVQVFEAYEGVEPATYDISLNAVDWTTGWNATAENDDNEYLAITLLGNYGAKGISLTDATLLSKCNKICVVIESYENGWGQLIIKSNGTEVAYKGFGTVTDGSPQTITIEYDPADNINELLIQGGANNNPTITVSSVYLVEKQNLIPGSPVYFYDYAGKTEYPWYHVDGWGIKPIVSSGVLSATNDEVKGDPSNYMFFVADNISTNENREYYVRATIKGSVAGSIVCNLGTWEQNIDKTLSFTDEYQEVDILVSGVPTATNSHVLFKIGKYVGTIYLKKIEVYEALATRTINVGEAGYMTYSSDYAFDTADKVKAYTAVYDQSQGKVMLTPISTIPANEGVIIKANQGTYQLPIISNNVSMNGINNELMVSDGYVSGNGNVFALGKKDDVVGFYRVSDYNYVPAGKAYLMIYEASREFIAFDNETTGINAVQSSGLKADSYYNLAGQRVAQPTKGLYIVNGKKVIIK